MKSLQDATEQEIEQELERRKRANFPKPLDKPDFSILTDILLKETMYLIKNGYQSKDIDHYVHVVAIEAIYGKDYWKWRNNLDY